jgi:hypothetical protein
MDDGQIKMSQSVPPTVGPCQYAQMLDLVRLFTEGPNSLHCHLEFRGGHDSDSHGLDSGLHFRDFIGKIQTGSHQDFKAEVINHLALVIFS